MPIVTIPHKGNLNRQSGSLVIQLSSDHQINQEHILTTGDFSLFYQNNGFVLRTTEKPKPTALIMTVDEYTTLAENGTVELNREYLLTDSQEPLIEHTLYLEADVFPGETTLVWTWIGDNHRLISLNQQSLEVLAENSDLTGNFGTIHLAKEPYFTGSYRSIQTYALDSLYTPARELLSALSASGSLLFQADYSSGVKYVKKPFIEATMVPNDASPIIVTDEDGPLRRQFFFDHESGLYAETNTESFVYKGEDVLHLSYQGLDPEYAVTVKIGDESIGNPIRIEGYKVFLTMTDTERAYWYGKTVKVTYRLDRAYVVEHNENTAHDSYIIKLQQHKSKEVTVIQEGNRFSNQKLATEIELNPIVNPQHTGFLYISTEEQVSQAFRLNLSSSYLIANGLDSADFIVEAIDDEGNEVLSPHVDVFIMTEDGKITNELGEFVPIINKDTLKARLAAGRCYFKYQSPIIRKDETKTTQKVYAVAFDRKHKIGAQVPLVIRPSEPVYTDDGSSYVDWKLVPEASPDAAIVFEYFARFYERPIPEEHPILLLDSDGDGVLTHTDLEQFLMEKTNNVRMQEIAYALKEKEVF